MGKHQIHIDTRNMDPGQSRNNVLFDLRGIRGDSGGGGQVYHNVKSISLKHMEIPMGGYVIDNYNNYLPLLYGLLVPTPGGDYNEETELISSDYVVGDKFGQAVAIDGNTILVGAYDDDSNTGAVYVFTRSGSTWTQQQKLTADPLVAGEQFGTAVAIDGDTAVVGATSFPNGEAVYVFTRSGSTWTQQQKLTADPLVAGDTFGVSVAISGDTIVAGAYLDDSNTGAVYVFIRSGGTWTQQAKLVAGDAAAGDKFGVSVAISGDTVVVGAYLDDWAADESGSAYVFTRSGISWSQTQKLLSSTPAAYDRFGVSVAILGDTIAVGASSQPAGGGTGSVYVFVLDSPLPNPWSQQQELVASDAAADDKFGISVSILDDMVVVGAMFDDDGGDKSGSAYVFNRSGITWTQTQKLVAGDSAVNDRFGMAVGISTATIVVGVRDGAVSAFGHAGVMRYSSFLVRIAPGEYTIGTLITEFNAIFVGPPPLPTPNPATGNDIFAPVDSSKVYYKTDSVVDSPTALPVITWSASSLGDRLIMSSSVAADTTTFSATNSLVTVNNHPGIIYNVIGLSLHTPVNLIAGTHGAEYHTCSRLDLSSVRGLQMTVGNKLNNYGLTRTVDNSGLSEYIHRDFFDTIPIDVPNGAIKYFSRKSDYNMIYHTRGEGEATINALRVAFYVDILNDIPYEFNGLDWSATFEVEGETSKIHEESS